MWAEWARPLDLPTDERVAVSRAWRAMIGTGHGRAQEVHVTLSLQEISDRLELADLVVRYSAAVDRRAWDLYESLFTPDAVIDYTEAGGIRGAPAEVRAWLEQVMPSFPAYQHLVSNTELDIDGDVATGRTMLFNPMGLPTPTGVHVAFVGLWYRDRFVRTPDGWRFAERYEELSWTANWPPGVETDGEGVVSR